MISERTPNVAIVDITLRGGEQSHSLIDRLCDKGIRVVVATGDADVSLRARASARQARLAKLSAAMNDNKEYTPIEILRERADGLVQRGNSLKKLVDAWQPLYDSLDQRQKVRLRIVAVLLLHELRDAVAERLEAADSDDYED